MPTPSLAGLRRKRIVCLPDFFLDAVVRLPPWAQARAQMDRIAAHGGGNLLVPPITFKAGGNATNLAFALARLGAKVDLIAQTDAVGRFVLGESTKGSGLGLEHVRVEETGPTTIALETGSSNVMLSHSGPVREFGPERLSAKAWRLIEGADAVAAVNWAQNRKGTALLRALARRLAGRPAFFFVDTADPRHRGADRDGLLGAKSIWRRVDAWGLNENELRAFTRDERSPLPTLAVSLSRRTQGFIDLHTRTWAVSARAGEKVHVAGERSRPLRLTGAGDAWNAGNLAGHLLGWGPRQRLALAHRVATRYVTSKTALPPTPREL
ncbi:MAG: carbohydrate kinase family protein [Euryarchaeota archaeon]|nr:carbohydrate kinase family protein [Euryarchaeota archaeon]